MTNTLRTLILNKCQDEMAELRDRIAGFEKEVKSLTESDKLNITVDKEHTTVYVYAGGSVYVYTDIPGEAQRLANELAIELGIEFYKSFKGDTGEQRYLSWVGDRYYHICGVPGPACKITWEEATITLTQRTAKVECGE